MKNFFKTVCLAFMASWGTTASFAQAPDGRFTEVVAGTKENPVVLATSRGALSLHYPEMGGSLQLGLVAGPDNFWLADRKCDMKRDRNGNLIYIFKDPFGVSKGGGGSLTLEVSAMERAQGFVMKVVSEGLPKGTQLCWALGGSYGKALDDSADSGIRPEYCVDNVFSVEGSAITVYYGESMRLRTLRALVPPGSEIRLSNAHRQATPVEFFGSGKKTDAPALCAMVDPTDGEPLYFSIFRRADYNYFMMPTLFDENFNSPEP